MPDTLEAPAVETKESTPVETTPAEPTETKAPADEYKSGWDDLDPSIFNAPESGDEKKEEKAKEEEPTKTEEKKEEPTEKVPPKEEKGEEIKAQNFRQMRSEYEKVKGEYANLTAERDTLKQQLADLEKGSKEKASKEAATIAEEAAALKKEREELVRQIEMLKYEESPTFKQQYNKPWQQAIADAQSDIKELKVVIGKDEETGEIKTRPATWDDFSAMWGMSRVGARNAARRLFGEDYDIAVKHYDKLQEMDAKAKQAIAEHRETYESKQKAEAAETARTRQAIESSWVKVNDDIKAKHPEWYAEDPDDKEGNDLLAQGYKMVDAAYGDRGDQTWQQKVVLDAQIRNRAAAFDRLVARLAKRDATIAELNKKIADYEGSAPGGGRKAQKTKAENDEGDLEALLREALPG